MFFLIVLIFFSVESSYCAEDPAKFSTRPITFICPLPPGSTGDVSDRLISKTAEKFLGQPVVVVNKPGGGTTIGTAAIAAAKPDGYTVGYTASGAMLIYPFVEQLPVFQNIVGPRGIPEEIVKKLEQAFTQAIKEPSFIKGLKDLRFPVVYRNSKEMAEHIADYYQFYGKILKEMGLAK